MEEDFLKTIRKARREAIYEADLRRLKEINVLFGGKFKGEKRTVRYLAIPGLIILMILVSAIAGIVTYKQLYDQEDTVIYNFPERTVREETTIKKIVNNNIIVPEGKKETCLKLDNESYRRCYDD